MKSSRWKLPVLLASAYLFFSSIAFATQDYRINPGDTLEISVYGEEDLAKTLRVNADGLVSFPLVGRFEVGGLTTFDVEDKLVLLLSDGYIVDPQVTVSISHYSKIYVAGQVNTPGGYELRGPLTVLEAVTLAGGLTEMAFPINSKVLRTKEDNSKEIIKVDLKRILEKDDQKENILLKPNDIIIVGEQGQIFVTGEVNEPGSFDFKKPYTVLQAISLAGGLTKIAAPNRTTILRSVDSQNQSLEVRVGDITRKKQMANDVELLPNDIVIVPESIF